MKSECQPKQHRTGSWVSQVGILSFFLISFSFYFVCTLRSSIQTSVCALHLTLFPVDRHVNWVTIKRLEILFSNTVFIKFWDIHLSKTYAIWFNESLCFLWNEFHLDILSKSEETWIWKSLIFMLCKHSRVLLLFDTIIICLK